MGDCLSKAHTGNMQKHDRPYYLQMVNPLRDLSRAAMVSLRQRCDKTLGYTNYKRVPFPHIPEYSDLAKTPT